MGKIRNSGTTTCQTCAKEIAETYPSHRRKYCSRECFHKRPKPPVVRVCPACQQEFRVRFRSSVKTFCSQKCASESNWRITRTIARAKARAKAGATAEGRICSKCRIWKTWDQYGKTHIGMYGHSARCKDCGFGDHQKYKYGIDIPSRTHYNALTGSHCGICEKPFGDKRKRATDHHHGDGTVRGFICCQCNSAGGFFGDDPDRVHLVVVFREKFEERRKAAIPLPPLPD